MEQDTNDDALWPWHWSKRNNLTRKFRGCRLTIFPDRFGIGFRWCISMNGEPRFSKEAFSTRRETMADCMAFAIGLTTSEPCYLLL